MVNSARIDSTSSLVVTDGSANLVFWDPDCWQTGHCAPVADRPPVQVTRLNGEPALELNEIEYWRGRVLANMWYSDVLLVINPDSGKVEKEYGECNVVWVLPVVPLPGITIQSRDVLTFLFLYFLNLIRFRDHLPEEKSRC